MTYPKVKKYEKDLYSYYLQLFSVWLLLYDRCTSIAKESRMKRRKSQYWKPATLFETLFLTCVRSLLDVLSLDKEWIAKESRYFYIYIYIIWNEPSARDFRAEYMFYNNHLDCKETMRCEKTKATIIWIVICT